MEVARFEGGDDGGVLGEGGTAEVWLEKAKLCVLLRPAAKLCVEKALAFLPKLKAASLRTRTRARRRPRRTTTSWMTSSTSGRAP